MKKWVFLPADIDRMTGNDLINSLQVLAMLAVTEQPPRLWFRFKDPMSGKLLVKIRSLENLLSELHHLPSDTIVAHVKDTTSEEELDIRTDLISWIQLVVGDHSLAMKILALRKRFGDRPEVFKNELISLLFARFLNYFEAMWRIGEDIHGLK